MGHRANPRSCVFASFKLPPISPCKSSINLKLLRARIEFKGRCRRLLRVGGIHLDDLVHLSGCPVYLLDSLGLFLRGGGNLADKFSGFGCAVQHPDEFPVCPIYQDCAIFDLLTVDSISPAVSLADSAVRRARFLTSSATTANPRPPHRRWPASTAALSAKQG